ncbi:hypothetical protein [Allobranchiibius sp. GilTou38]|uniref:8-oxoguanine DNA glycosylase OGG fold protein n=1 Tax=Allobranchiibius sp. GilTou38 TaxID=2815210 RepID=UPI001AA14A50|nr:hypothetical protein [Allobranchiibius sp. GilTou38]MBO1765930.1 hypothetical protein [Allobranchiibius sp. GilTou38]
MLEHGFHEGSIGSVWWNKQLHIQGLGQRVGLFEHGGAQRLTGGDLFRLAQPASRSDATDNDVLTFLWHVLARGTGPSQRGNRQRIEAFVPPAARERNVARLKEANSHARDGDVAAAYRCLIRRGGGQIRGLGPAFFTKLLYFSSEGTPGTRCLILDARVAESLAEAGWSSLPCSSRNRYSYNWFTTTYDSYCKLLREWAETASNSRGSEVWPDEIERALFDRGA